MRRFAFTMIELVFVIVVIGILAMAIIPRMDRDTLYEASEQLLSHIKYTQHLAMTDNVFPNTANRWGIDLNSSAYTISGSGVTAKDPLTGEEIDGSGIFDLSDKYNATVDSFTVYFDHLGRPYEDDPTGDAMEAPLNINVTANGETATITITPETGYSFITF